jgi:hypothetical protein
MLKLKRKLSEETRTKMAKAKQGIARPQEVKDKIRATMLANWATIPYITEATPKDMEVAYNRESLPEVITLNSNAK